jgi:hypothetical protein
MLTQIPASFSTLQAARVALTEFRKHYKCAMRGAVIVGPDFHGAFYVHAPLGGSGFSAAEFAGALRAGNY